MKPRILLTPRVIYDTSRRNIIGNKEDYEILIRNSGGIPVPTSFVNQEEAIVLAQNCDGLLITGGADVKVDAFDIPLNIDSTDYYLYLAFKALKKPILGICRGIQLIGAVEGVSLVRDLPSAGKNDHMQPNNEETFYSTYHSVIVEENTSLSSLLGHEHEVNSFHHQALTAVPPGFKLIATSKEDHVIEAIEKENILAVQWHPERLIHDDSQLGIAKLFISSCHLFKPDKSSTI